MGPLSKAPGVKVRQKCYQGKVLPTWPLPACYLQACNMRLRAYKILGHTPSFFPDACGCLKARGGGIHKSKHPSHGLLEVLFRGSRSCSLGSCRLGLLWGSCVESRARACWGGSQGFQVMFCLLVKGCLGTFSTPGQSHTLPSQGPCGCIGREGAWSPRDNTEERGESGFANSVNWRRALPGAAPVG